MRSLRFVPGLVASLLPDASVQAAERARDSARGIGVVLFGSFEGGTTLFGSAGFKRRLTGRAMDRSGFTTMTIAGAGEERRRGPFWSTGRAVTWTVQTRSMIGYQSFEGPIGWALHVGLEDIRSIGKPDLRLRSDTGIALMVDLWAEPSPGTRTEVSFAASTARESIWLRGAAGWPIPSAAAALAEWRLGPEIIVYGDDGSRQARLGLQVAPLIVLGVSFRLTGGWQWQDDGRRGPYWTLTGWASL